LIIYQKGANIHPAQIVKIKWMKNLIQVISVDRKNDGFKRVKKLSDNRYLNLETGEIKKGRINTDNSKNIESMRKTKNKLFNKINHNFEGKPNEKFLTLTYAENMNNPEQLYKDFDRFWKKYRYRFGKFVDYISIVEPQERGAFHFHVLIRHNDQKTIIIPVDGLEHMWKNGQVWIEPIKDVQHLANYFMKFECIHHYPPNMKLVRSSKGIISPKEEKMMYAKFQDKIKEVVGDTTPNYSYTIPIHDSDKVLINTIRYEYYNNNSSVEDRI
jgi:hypothetical protein